jgi:hypothetical protein
MNWIARLLVGLLGLLVLAALLVALCIYIVFATVRWLLTGRKPQVVMVWQQFNALRKGAHWKSQHADSSGFSRDFQTQAQDDIVDVEVREVLDDAPQLQHQSFQPGAVQTSQAPPAASKP